jgi:TolA-binding protein
MNAVPWLTRIPFLAILACQPLLVTPVLAQEEDLQETLRRMEQLLQRQQAELEAQRRELAEQRTLIEQLQGAQQPAPGKDEISPSLTDEPTGEEKQLADTAADEAPAKTDEAPAEVAQDAWTQMRSGMTLPIPCMTRIFPAHGRYPEPPLP